MVNFKKLKTNFQKTSQEAKVLFSTYGLGVFGLLCILILGILI